MPTGYSAWRRANKIGGYRRFDATKVGRIVLCAQSRRTDGWKDGKFDK